MTIGATPICVFCSHWHRVNLNGMTCEAYPEGIPKDIILNRQDHRQHLPDDQNIKFNPIDQRGIQHASQMFDE
jgi:hypothetical protein